MNYVEQMQGFFVKKQTAPLSANAQCLYINLFFVNNMAGWADEISVSNTYLQALTNLSRIQLDRARNELVQKGFIDYLKGSGNRAGKYLLVCFDTQRDTQMIHKRIHKCSTNVYTNVAHNINKTKTKQKENIPPTPQGGAATHFDYEAVKDLFNELCGKLPRVERITDQRHRAIRGLVKAGETMDDFRTVFQAVSKSDFLTGKDGKWGGCCFDWILKPANWQKIKEGNYANPQKKSKWDDIQIIL